MKIINIIKAIFSIINGVILPTINKYNRTKIGVIAANKTYKWYFKIWKISVIIITSIVPLLFNKSIWRSVFDKFK